MARTPTSLIQHVTMPLSANQALDALSPILARWFARQFQEPTPSQMAAWPQVAAGQNLLLSAPTGTGKTLAAFLPILDKMCDEAPAPGVRCIFITPLKALANDTTRTLRTHLESLADSESGFATQPRVEIRTGDTSPKQRRLLRDNPPEVMITTPESLAVLLSQAECHHLFHTLRWVVIDEIHNLAASKRGADLSLSLERLCVLADFPVQRIGLSATVSPPEEVARFLVGRNRSGSIATVTDSGPLEITVEALGRDIMTRDNDKDYLTAFPRGFMTGLTDRLGKELQCNRNTLIFTNSRALSELVSWLLRKHFPQWDDQIAVHHGSLAWSRRRDVEERLKQGQLRAIVCSTSLELGIDIGNVDGVVLIHPPGAVVRLLQRVGRSGHRPGQSRRGLILASNAGELLEAAVISACGQSAQCETLRLPAAPLDVLCQQLVGMASSGQWKVDAAFDLVRQAYPFKELLREDFDDCLNYLAGRDNRSEEWLPPRIEFDGNTFTIASEATARLMRSNLGTILGDDLRSVRMKNPPEAPNAGADGIPFSRQQTETHPIGEIAEYYAEKLKPGDRFLLDGRCLEYRRGDAWTIVVDEVVGIPANAHWSGAPWPISAELARHLYGLRIRAAEALRDGPEKLADLFRRDYHLEGEAVTELIEYFQAQESISEIPESQACLVERVAMESWADYYIHTPLNQPANQALAYVAALRLSREGFSVSSLAADLGFAISLPEESPVAVDHWRKLLAIDGFLEDLREAIEQSELLRDRFQRTATTGLMLLRRPQSTRRRVGGQGWGARRLFDQVRNRHADFVLLRQARNEMMTESCDAQAAMDHLSELKQFLIRCRDLTVPSPFTRGWTQVEDAGNQDYLDPAAALERLQAQLLTPDPRAQ